MSGDVDLGPADAGLGAYKVRVSAKTRRVRLVMTVAGLEVVIPRGFDRRRIPELVDSKRDWIDKTRRRFEARRLRFELDPPRLPERIVLAAVDEEWLVEYRPQKDAGRLGVAARAGSGRRLVVSGSLENDEACRQALRGWLTRRAREELVPRLASLAKEHGLAYQRVSIRQQQSRWGSFSRRGCISLNAKLLFLPPAAVDYVLLHELCHSLELNHSPRFWALMDRHDPKYRAHRKLVRTATKSVPTWLDNEPFAGEL